MSPKRFAFECFRDVADAIALAGPQGLTIKAAAFTASRDESLPSNNFLERLVQQFRLRSPRLFEIHEFEGQDGDEVVIVACQELRKYALGWSSVEHQNLSETAWMILEAVGKHGKEGVLQAELAKELKISPRNIHHYIMSIVASELVGRVRMVGHTGDGSRINNSAYILLTRFAIQKSRDEEREARQHVNSGKRAKEGSVPALEEGTGGDAITEKGSEEYADELAMQPDPSQSTTLPLESHHDMARIKNAMKLLEEAQENVIAQSDLKLLVFPDKDRPDTMTIRHFDKKRHRFYRRVRDKMLRLGVAKEIVLPAKDSMGVFRGDIPCLKLVRRSFNDNDEKKNPEPAPGSSAEADVTRLLVEPDLAQQVYDLMAESGDKGITAHEITCALGPQVGAKRVARFLKAISAIHKVKAIHRFEGRTLVKPLALIREATDEPTPDAGSASNLNEPGASAVDDIGSKAKLEKLQKEQTVEARNVLSVRREAIIKEWIVSRRVLQMDKIGRELATAEEASYARVDSRVLRRIFDRLLEAGVCKVLHVAHPTSPSSATLRLLVAADVTMSSVEVQEFLKKATFSTPIASNNTRKLFRGKQSKAIDSQLIRALRTNRKGKNGTRALTENVLRKRRDRRPADLILQKVPDAEQLSVKTRASSPSVNAQSKGVESERPNSSTIEIRLTDEQCAANYSGSDRKLGKVIAVEYGFNKSLMQRSLMLHKCIYDFLRKTDEKDLSDVNSHSPTCAIKEVLALPPLGEFKFQTFLDDLDLGSYAEIFGIHVDIGDVDDNLRTLALREVTGDIRSKCLNNRASVYNMRKALEILLKMGLVKPTDKNEWMLCGGGLFLDFGLGLPFRRARGVAFNSVSDVDFFWEEVESKYKKGPVRQNQDMRNALDNEHHSDEDEASELDKADPRSISSTLGDVRGSVPTSTSKSKFIVKELYSAQHWKASRLLSVSERNAAVIENAFQNVLSKKDQRDVEQSVFSAHHGSSCALWKDVLPVMARILLYDICHNINMADLSLEQVFLYYSIRRKNRMPLSVQARLERDGDLWTETPDSGCTGDPSIGGLAYIRPRKRRKLAEKRRGERILSARSRSGADIAKILSRRSRGRSKRHGKVWKLPNLKEIDIQSSSSGIICFFLVDIAKVKSVFGKNTNDFVLSPFLWESISERYRGRDSTCEELLSSLLKIPPVAKAMDETLRKVESFLQKDRKELQTSSTLPQVAMDDQEKRLDMALVQSFAEALGNEHFSKEGAWTRSDSCLSYATLRNSDAKWPKFSPPEISSRDVAVFRYGDSGLLESAGVTDMKGLTHGTRDLVQEVLKVVFREPRQTYRPLAAMRILSRLETEYIKIVQADLRDRNIIRYTRSDIWKRRYMPAQRVAHNADDNLLSQTFISQVATAHAQLESQNGHGNLYWDKICSLSDDSSTALGSVLQKAVLGSHARGFPPLKIVPSVAPEFLQNVVDFGEHPSSKRSPPTNILQWTVDMKGIPCESQDKQSTDNASSPLPRSMLFERVPLVLPAEHNGKLSFEEYWAEFESKNVYALLKSLGEERARQTSAVYNVIKREEDEGLPSHKLWSKCPEMPLRDVVSVLQSLIRTRIVHRFALRDHESHLSGGGAFYMCQSWAMKYSLSPYSLDEDPMNISWNISSGIPLRSWTFLNSTPDSHSLSMIEYRIISTIMRMPGVEERQLLIRLSDTDVPKRALLDVCATLEACGCLRSSTTESGSPARPSILGPVPTYSEVNLETKSTTDVPKFVDELELSGKGKYIKTYYFPGLRFFGPFPTVQDVYNVALQG
eukprot:Plantae.Rhodophyta-Hildenbrandia_rubra.ctg2126.p1 GENE.Plantae.Rhodophyta-Hildenbrandia_rubra.ctg2126~~Plantae.Rhodophyta-Hildenbrandia_rubra.ctg2126.p1  ORF type:complete len:1788 (-),score=263.98 Plantae.Rhodophyta-Hildenbrandia_rubra.ctg2126:1743-7106(-)